MHRFMVALVLLPAVVSVGCGTEHKLESPNISLSRSGLIDEEQAEQLRMRLTDRDIADWLDADIQPRLPTPLAVAKLVPPGRWYRSRPDRFEIDSISQDELEGWQKAVAGVDGIEDVLPLADVLISARGADLKELRHAAARQGCELLLIYARADSYVDNYTDAAVLYWTIIGLWTVPANVGEHETVMQAVLLDTRTGAVLTAATGSHHVEKHYPSAYKDNRRVEMASEARREALEKLQDRFTAVVSRLGA